MCSLRGRALLFLVSLPALFQIYCGSSGYSKGSTNVPPAAVTVTPNTVSAVPGGATVNAPYFRDQRPAL